MFQYRTLSHGDALVSMRIHEPGGRRKPQIEEAISGHFMEFQLFKYCISIRRINIYTNQLYLSFTKSRLLKFDSIRAH